MSGSPGADFPLDAPESLELSEGLYMRHLCLGDAPIVFATVQENRAYLRRWLPWVDETRSVSDTLRFIEESQRRRVEGSALVYGCWRDLEFCGVTGLHDIDRANGNAQIGYWLKEAEQGKGWMTQCCVSLMGIAFEILDLERIEIRCAVGNEKSSAIPLRLGFSPEGKLRHGQRLGGEFLDLRVYSLLVSEYRERISGLTDASTEQI